MRTPQSPCRSSVGPGWPPACPAVELGWGPWQGRLSGWARGGTTKMLGPNSHQSQPHPYSLTSPCLPTSEGAFSPCQELVLPSFKATFHSVLGFAYKLHLTWAIGQGQAQMPPTSDLSLTSFLTPNPQHFSEDLTLCPCSTHSQGFGKNQGRHQSTSVCRGMRVSVLGEEDAAEAGVLALGGGHPRGCGRGAGRPGGPRLAASLPPPHHTHLPTCPPLARTKQARTSLEGGGSEGVGYLRGKQSFSKEMYCSLLLTCKGHVLLKGLE